MEYVTIFPERKRDLEERLSGERGYEQHAEHADPEPEPEPQQVDAGPGADKFEEFRDVHGDQPCPGDACKAHGGQIAVRVVVTGGDMQA